MRKVSLFRQALIIKLSIAQVFLTFHMYPLGAQARSEMRTDLSQPSEMENQCFGKGEVNADLALWNGYFDNTHSVNDNSSPHMKTLYALRNLKTLDLLRERKTYRELLYNHGELDFSAPLEVEKVYAGTRIPERDVKTEVVQVMTVVKQLQAEQTLSELPRPERNQRTECLKGMKYQVFQNLALFASQLVRIDADIRFLEKDLWKQKKKDPIWAERARANSQEVSDRRMEPLTKPGQVAWDVGKPIDIMPTASNPLQGWLSRGEVKKDLKVQLGITGDENSEDQSLGRVQSLLALKSNLLREFPVLSIPVKRQMRKDKKAKKDQKELYKHIYDLLHEKFDFPAAHFIEDASVVDFNANIETVVWPQEMSDRIGERWDYVLGKYSMEWWTDLLFDQGEQLFDDALLAALGANTKTLRLLNKKIEIKKDAPIFMLLALNPRSREVLYGSTYNAKAMFPDQKTPEMKDSSEQVHQGVFDYGFESIGRLLDKQEKRSQMWSKIRNISGYASVGVGFATVMLVGWTGLGGLVGGSALALGTAFLGAEELAKYTKSKKYAELSKNLFYAAPGSSDYNMYKNWQIVSKESLRSLILLGAFSIIGARGIKFPLTKTMQKVQGLGKSMVQAAGRHGVRVASDALKQLQRGLSWIKRSNFKKFAYIKSQLQRFKALALENKVVQKVFEVQKEMARMAGKTVAYFRDQAMKSEMIRRTVIASKDSKFASNLIRENIVELGVVLVIEMTLRGEHLARDWPFMVMNIMFGFLIVSYYVRRTSYATVMGEKTKSRLIYPGLRIDNELAKQGKKVFASQGAPRFDPKGFFSTSKDYALVAGGLAGLGNAIIETWLHIQHPDEMTVQERMMRWLAITGMMSFSIASLSALKSEAFMLHGNDRINYIAAKYKWTGFDREMTKALAAFTNNAMGVAYLTCLGFHLPIDYGEGSCIPQVQAPWMYRQKVDRYIDGPWTRTGLPQHAYQEMYSFELSAFGSDNVYASYPFLVDTSDIEIPDELEQMAEVDALLDQLDELVKPTGRSDGPPL